MRLQSINLHTLAKRIVIVLAGITAVLSLVSLASPRAFAATESGSMGLEGKTGDELDKAFLAEMIVHHEGAVQMAQTLLKGTKRPELIKLGNDIITAQTGEIQMMKQWQRDWFNQ